MNHSKVLVTLIICVGIIVSFAIVSKKTPIHTTSLQAQKDIITTTDTSSDSDNDADGLKDWEESLIGTDPRNPDTDADGTADGEEIAQGRDPRKAGPNDKDTIKNPEGLQKNTNESDFGLTEQVAKDFFSRYIAAKQQNKDLTREDAGLIAQSVIQNVSVPVTMRTYTIKDIKNTQDTSLTAKEAYKQELISALRKNSPKNLEHELVIVTQALESQMESDLLQMDLIINGYKGIIADTLNATVPINATTDHLLYLNALSAVYDDLTYMRLILSDPIIAYASLSDYQVDVLKLKVTFENISAYFVQ